MLLGASAVVAVAALAVFAGMYSNYLKGSPLIFVPGSQQMCSYADGKVVNTNQEVINANAEIATANTNLNNHVIATAPYRAARDAARIALQNAQQDLAANTSGLVDIGVYNAKLQAVKDAEAVLKTKEDALQVRLNEEAAIQSKLGQWINAGKKWVATRQGYIDFLAGAPCYSSPSITIVALVIPALVVIPF